MCLCNVLNKISQWVSMGLISTKYYVSVNVYFEISPVTVIDIKFFGDILGIVNIAVICRYIQN